MSSLFGSGGAAPSTTTNVSPRMDMALVEVDMMRDVFNRLVSSCHSKCVSPRYAEPDLNKGESVCVDRCVAKFFEVNKRVEERWQVANTSAQAAGMSSPFGGM